MIMDGQILAMMEEYLIFTYMGGSHDKEKDVGMMMIFGEHTKPETEVLE